MPGYYDNQIATAESNYQASLSKLNNIKESSYVYYTTGYRTEKKRHVSGWKWTHYKTRYIPYQIANMNHAQYNHDKAEAGKDLESKARSVENAYSSAISAKNSEVSSLRSQISIANSESQRIQNLCADASNRLSTKKSELSVKNREVSTLKSNLSASKEEQRLLNNEHQKLLTIKEEIISNNEKENIELNNLLLVIEEENDNINMLESACKEEREKINDLSLECEELESGVHSKIREVSNQERAELFLQFYKDDSLSLLKEELLAQGIDLNYIAYKAILDVEGLLDLNHREDLLDYVIEKGIDFDKDFANKTSLLLSAVMYDSPFINKILEHTENYDNSLISLISDGDLELFSKLIKLKEDLVSLNIKGLNLLHMAILAQNLEFVEYLLEYHNELLEQNTSDDVSSFYISLFKGNSEVILRVGEYVNIDQEINNILNSTRVANKEELIEKIVELFPEEITASLIHSLLLDESKENIVSILMEHYQGDKKSLGREILDLSSLERLEEEDILSNIVSDSKGNAHNEDILDSMDFHVDYNDM